MVAFLLKHWRLLAYAVAAPVLVWLLLLVRHWRTDSVVELPKAQAALAAEIECVDGSACQKRIAKAQTDAAAKQYAADQEVLDGYQKGLQAVSDYAAAHPAPSVRLCRPAGATDVRVPGTAGPADGAAPGRDVPLEAGSDIGRQLFDLADSADREALKLRALQQWNQALAKVPE